MKAVRILYILLLIGISNMASSFNFNKTTKADFIIINARIWTANEKQPYAEAMALYKDKIVAIGKSDEVENLLIADEKKLMLVEN